MSSYTSSVTTVSVAECMAIVNSWSLSTAHLSVLETLRSQVNAGIPLAQIVAEHGPGLTAVISAVATAPTPAMAPKVDSIAPVTSQLKSAVGVYQAVLGEVVRDTVIEALKSAPIGFDQVKVSTGAEGIAIEARRGHSVAQVYINPDLTMEREWALGPGDACVPLDAAFTEYLVARGIRTSAVRSDRHDGKRDGAYLVGPARAADPVNPTQGALRVRRRGSVKASAAASRQARAAAR